MALIVVGDGSCRPLFLIFLLPNLWSAWWLIGGHWFLVDEASKFTPKADSAVVDIPMKLWDASSELLDDINRPPGLLFGAVESNDSDNDTNLTCRAMKSFLDIQRCHPDTMKIPQQESCKSETIETWSDVQTCLNGPMVKPVPPFVLGQNISVHLVGERNSGTKFVIYQLKACFPKREFPGLTIHRDFWRNKHFFQPTISQVNKTQHRILISIFREPTDWVAAMIRKPYHMPYHMKGLNPANYTPSPLEWQKFVAQPWSMQHITEEDKNLIRNNMTHKILCQWNFTWGEVTPCQWWNDTLPWHVIRAQYPTYELRRDGSQKPFNHILEMRSDKIINFLLEMSLLQRLRGYLAVRYEDLVFNGTRAMLEEVAGMIGLPGLPAGCDPQPPQPNRLKKQRIPVGLRRWVEKNLNKQAERLLGYRD